MGCLFFSPEKQCFPVILEGDIKVLQPSSDRWGNQSPKKRCYPRLLRNRWHLRKRSRGLNCTSVLQRYCNIYHPRRIAPRLRELSGNVLSASLWASFPWSPFLMWSLISLWCLWVEGSLFWCIKRALACSHIAGALLPLGAQLGRTSSSQEELRLSGPAVKRPHRNQPCPGDSGLAPTHTSKV